MTCHTHENLYAGPLTPEQRAEIKKWVKANPTTDIPYAGWMSRFDVSKTSINAYLIVLLLLDEVHRVELD